MRTARYPSTIILITVILLLLLSGCRDDEDVTPTASTPPDSVGTGIAQDPQERGTPTVTSAPSATPTPVDTSTPTITPTPSPTIPPITLDGDPRALAVREPEAQPGAPCGSVDILDFPLDPPDAERISRGGQDFSVFRRRYDGYHAGEDWWGVSRSTTFGMPVYSIGHGQVTYANPWGWGADQGVVIVRHVNSDGSTFLSFYGHLDPPSIVLRHGNCVARGDLIGNIGRPRSSPHLHFEIRTHTPDDPGPGYWSVDPASAGWLPPSHTIWNQRILISPGVQWTRPFANAGTIGVGIRNGKAIMLEGQNLIALNPTDGAELWRHVLVDEPATAAEENEFVPAAATATLDALAPIVYTADRYGKISAFRVVDETQTDGSVTAPSGQPLWDLQLHNVRGNPTLIPLPDGGVILFMQKRMIALSPAGALLWRQTFEAQPLDWLLLEDQVLFSTMGQGPSLWTISNSGLVSWDVQLGGMLLDAGSEPLLYNGDGLYRLDLEAQSAALFFPLTRGLLSQSDAMVLPDGGILLAHMDAGGRRLLALNPDGSLRWERAYAGLLDGKPQLLLKDTDVFLLSEETSNGWSRVSLYAIAAEDAGLTLLFNGGTRSQFPDQTWALAGDGDQLLVNIGSGSLVALDTLLAAQELCNAGPVLACQLTYVR